MYLVIYAKACVVCIAFARTPPLSWVFLADVAALADQASCNMQHATCMCAQRSLGRIGRNTSRGGYASDTSLAFGLLLQ